MNAKEESTREYIADLIVNGYSNGFYPNWNITFFDVYYDMICDSDRRHIANAIRNGYIEGEVIIDNKNSDKNGWWKLQIQSLSI
jgi:hypothetical protein